MQANERLQQEVALRRAVLAGDSAAWRALYDGAFAELWAYVVWRCAGMRDLAEDVTQETWLVAVRRVGDFDPRRGRFLSWLRGIAAKALQNQLRVRQRREGSLTGNEESAAGDESHRREQAELIAWALAQLPEPYENALRAKYLDLQSVAEIASGCGETVKTIESRLTRAREAFRAAYEKQASTDVMVRDAEP